MENTAHNCKHGKNYFVPVEDLAPDPNQARTYFDLEAQQALIESISRYGLINPIIVTASSAGGLQIVAGERRWRAAKDAGLKSVEIRYIDRNTDEVAVMENLLREDLLPLEMSEALDGLRRSHGYRLKDLAQISGKSVSTISEMLTLCDLDDDIKQECRHDKRFVYSRLLQIAKTRGARNQQRLFTDYKHELDGLKPKNKGSHDKVSGLVSRIEAIITQIDGIDCPNQEDPNWVKLRDKLLRLHQCVTVKIGIFEGLIISEFRNSSNHLEDYEDKKAPASAEAVVDEKAKAVEAADAPVLQ